MTTIDASVGPLPADLLALALEQIDASESEAVSSVADPASRSENPTEDGREIERQRLNDDLLQMITGLLQAETPEAQSSVEVLLGQAANGDAAPLQGPQAGSFVVNVPADNGVPFDVFASTTGETEPVAATESTEAGPIDTRTADRLIDRTAANLGPDLMPLDSGAGDAPPADDPALRADEP